MSNKTTDYINPYKPVATLYKNGLDYIITCMTTSSSSSSCDCDCSDVTVEKLINCVCAYLFSIKDIDPNDPDNLLYVTNIRVTVANAVNGYLDKGSAAIGTLRGLETVPVKDINAYFDRLDQSVGDSSIIKGSKSNQQLVLSIGRASYEYWTLKISDKFSPWAVYLDGNVAIDTANIPYWVSAAMFGSQFNFWQDNATDSEAVTSALYTALGGALVVGAGKVIFGWVPKEDCGCNKLEGISSVSSFIYKGKKIVNLGPFQQNPGVGKKQCRYYNADMSFDGLDEYVELEGGVFCRWFTTGSLAGGAHDCCPCP